MLGLQGSKAPDKDTDGPFCPLTIGLADMVSRGSIQIHTLLLNKVYDSAPDMFNNFLAEHYNYIKKGNRLETKLTKK